jgi:hypothetical protein
MHLLVSNLDAFNMRSSFVLLTTPRGEERGSDVQ